jgi:hypothetical protein
VFVQESQIRKVVSMFIKIAKPSLTSTFAKCLLLCYRQTNVLVFNQNLEHCCRGESN